MALTKGTLVSAVFAAAIVGAAGVLYLMPPKEPAGSARAPAERPLATPSTSALGAGAAPATPTAATTVAAVARCDFDPILGKAGEGDGQVRLEAKPKAASAGEVSSLILSGKEAAAAGRQRDAEITFINACRNAEAVPAEDRLPVADAMYQLGRHYAMLAPANAARKTELMRRSELLYAASLQTYRTAHGESHEKTRFAAEGLAAVQRVTGGTLPGPVAIAPAPKGAEAPAVVAKAPEKAPEKPSVVARAPVPPAVVAPPAAAPAPAAPVQEPPRVVQAPRVVEAPKVVEAPRPAKPVEAPRVVEAPKKPVAPAQPAPATQQAARPADSRPAESRQARRTSPSFNCAQARSTTEKLICGDEELARMDRDLGRIYDRAKRAAPDPRAFQRESDAEWKRREDTCRDAECLRRWYAQRREQLGAERTESAAAPRREARPEARAEARSEPVARAAPRPAAPPQPVRVAPARPAQRAVVVEGAADIPLPPGESVPTASGSVGDVSGSAD